MAENFLKDIANQVLNTGEYSSVLILCTKYDPDKRETIAEHNNAGNFYASLGAAREWLERDSERNREDVRRQRSDE